MLEKKETRSDEATSERANGAGVVCRQSTDSTFKFNTIHSKTQEGRISKLLSIGRANAITLQELVAPTGWDERVIRQRIATERKAGILIMSDNQRGYFLPETADDLRRFSRSMAHRAGEILHVAQLAEDAIAKIDGQEQIGGW